jgi:hypothetical protein
MPYTAEQIRDFLKQDSNKWPEDFLQAVYDRLANYLLDSWIESNEESVVEDRLTEVAEDMADERS